MKVTTRKPLPGERVFGDGLGILILFAPHRPPISEINASSSQTEGSGLSDPKETSNAAEMPGLKDKPATPSSGPTD